MESPREKATAFFIPAEMSSKHILEFMLETRLTARQMLISGNSILDANIPISSQTNIIIAL